MSGEKVVEEPKKRGRGRPPKLDAQGNPTAVAKVVTNRKRGRPPRVPTNNAAAASEEVSFAADATVPSSPETKVVKVAK
jgi:AT hook motif